MFKLVLAVFTVTIFANCSAQNNLGSTESKLKTEPGSTPLQENEAMVSGPGSGNGGKGVLIDGRPYLFDLVESGVEKAPYFNDAVKTDPEILKRLTQIFDGGFPIEKIAHKLTEVMQQNYARGILILKTMELYRWRIVDLSPTPVNDHRPGVDVEDSAYVQIALRLRKTIIINREVWLKMDQGNQTATIFHEVIYAFTPPRKNRSGYMTQDTGAVQEFTAFLFSPDFGTSPMLGSYAADVLPEEMKWGGEAVVDDSVLAMLSFPREIIFYLAKGYADLKHKVEVSRIRIEVLINLPDRPATMAQNICANVTAERNVLLHSVSLKLLNFKLTTYEGQPDKFYSYVKVASSIHDSADSTQGLSQEFSKPECLKIVEAYVTEAKKEALRNTKSIKQ